MQWDIKNDEGTHIINMSLYGLSAKYVVMNKVSTSYNPWPVCKLRYWTRGQPDPPKDCECPTNRMDRNLDDAWWAYQPAYKTLIGSSPYKMVCGKACHLLAKLKHKAY